jgi:hypothetical protein
MHANLKLCERESLMAPQDEMCAWRERGRVRRQGGE